MDTCHVTGTKTTDVLITRSPPLKQLRYRERIFPRAIASFYFCYAKTGTAFDFLKCIYSCDITQEEEREGEEQEEGEE